MQATIEIDLGPLASDWEVVAVRPPKLGDVYWYRDQPIKATQDWKTEPMIIIRRKWVWPSWLTARWYYENSEGRQLISNVAPVIDTLGTYWACPDHTRITGKLDIPKIGGDWHKSLRENPNWKASQE